MNTIKTKTLLASAVISLAIAGPLQANMFATAVLDVTSFKILGGDGEILDASSDFASLFFTSSADTDGFLDGSPSFDHDVPNSVTSIDIAADCTGSGCNVLTENTFPIISGDQGSTYVTADQQQIGSPIANLPGFVGDGANVAQASYGSLATPFDGGGSSNVNNGLEANWQFQLNQDQTITFAGDFRAYVEAFAGADEVFPGKARGTISFSISVTDTTTGLVVFLLAPTPFNQTTSASATGDPADLQLCAIFTCGTAGAGSFADTTGLLLADRKYQLSIQSNANIDISREHVAVPEPGVLALLGMGMMGMFLSRRRG